MDRDRLLLAINAAELAGFTHYAQSLRLLLAIEHPLPGNPAERGVPGTNTGPAAAGNGAPSTVFRQVTGADFGRAIKHARARGNPVTLQLQAIKARLRPANPCSSVPSVVKK